VSLHGKNGLGKKDKKGWCCDKILVHLKEFGPRLVSPKKIMKSVHKPSFVALHSIILK
jgi:hypothetical protein